MFAPDSVAVSVTWGAEACLAEALGAVPRVPNKGVITHAGMVSRSGLNTGRPRRGKDEGTGRSEGSAETPPNPAKDTPPTDEPKEKVNQQQPPQPEKEHSPPAEKDDKEAVEQVAQVANAIQEAAKV